MEFEGLGARCSLPSCGRLDYLPYKCTSCSRPFCESHATPSAHSCSAAPRRDVPSCPLCNAAVPLGPHDRSLDDAMARHIDQGCPKRPRSNPKCALDGCSVRDPAATMCRSCGKIFCVAHCVEINHDCSKALLDNNNNNHNNSMSFAKNPFRRTRPTQQSKIKTKPNTITTSAAAASNATATTSTTNSNSTISTKTPKILSFANTPSTPLSEFREKDISDVELIIRLSVYFNVLTSTGKSIAPRYMRFSKKNSSGRIVDVVRKLISDVPPPPTGKRYAVYAVRSDFTRVNLLPYVTPLRDLKNVVSDGDMLVLQLADNGLEPEFLNAMRRSTPRFHSSPVPRKVLRPPERTNTKCLMT